MENLIISICLSSLLAGFAIYKKAFTKNGVIIALLLSILITYCGGVTGFVILVTTFLATMIAGKIAHTKRELIVQNTNQKHGKRDAVQVLANVGMGTLSLLLFYFTKDNIYLITYACVMASSLADSMASEIGVLAQGNPIDICTFKKTVKGISGGITRLGLCASLFGSFVIAFLFYLLTNSPLSTLLFITVLGFIGALIDSILCSLVQVKYQCPKCHKITEKKVHCNCTTNYLSGIKIIDNDFVNILNNVSVFILSILLLMQFHL
ncbi:MAG: DUF92 domain-containing protein [Bacilli bacterium]|nr:DUF92 domain-containing protein [Bacilli bacterium]